MPETTPAAPTLTVEKVDSEPRHGDDFGADATVGQKDAHKLRAQDAEPDYVVVRAGTRTPDIASSAAEVADSAMILDREVSYWGTLGRFRTRACLGIMIFETV
jgi:hypothetical protein